jgi:hypothetical protein
MRKRRDQHSPRNSSVCTARLESPSRQLHPHTDGFYCSAMTFTTYTSCPRFIPVSLLMPFVASAGRLSRLTGKPMNVRLALGHVYSREAKRFRQAQGYSRRDISHRCKKSASLHQIRDSPLPSPLPSSPLPLAAKRVSRTATCLHTIAIRDTKPHAASAIESRCRRIAGTMSRMRGRKRSFRETT